MKKKMRVGIPFGGKSAEHEVSLQSAKNIVDAVDRTIFLFYMSLNALLRKYREQHLTPIIRKL